MVVVSVSVAEAGRDALGEVLPATMFVISGSEGEM
jgi:hypothetical protein